MGGGEASIHGEKKKHEQVMKTEQKERAEIRSEEPQFRMARHSDQHVQPENYFELESEEEISLSEEEEQELKRYQKNVVKPERFQKASAGKEWSMKKFHRQQYADYQARKSQHAESMRSYHARKNKIRASYIKLARTKRRVQGEENDAIRGGDVEKIKQRLQQMEDMSSPEYRKLRRELDGISSAYNEFLQTTDRQNYEDVRGYTLFEYHRVNDYYRFREEIKRENPRIPESDLENQVKDRLYDKYSKISSLPSKEKWFAQTKRLSENLNSLLRTTTVPRDIVVTRVAGFDSLAGMGFQGIPGSRELNDLNFTQNSEKLIDTALSKYNGSKHDIVKEPGACSTACGENANGVAVKYVILVHKGTPAAPVMKSSQYEDENEVLLAPGQKFRILKAEGDLQSSFAAQTKPRWTVYLETVNENDPGLAA